MIQATAELRRGWTLGELYDMPAQASRFVVDDVLPTGLLLLVASPKSGKTRLMLQIAEAVARGGVALNRYATQQGTVLYYALEDRRARIARSAEEIGLERSNDLVFFDTLEPLVGIPAYPAVCSG